MNRLRSECITCLIDSQVKKIPENITEEERVQYLQNIFRILADASMETSAPVIVWKINQMKDRLFHLKDDYTEVKKYFNQIMMDVEDEITENISKSECPLKLAIQYSMVGNYIDFGAMEHVDEKYLLSQLAKAQEIQVDSTAFKNLENDLAKGENFVLLTDNCGEVVMDKLLVEEIKREFPHLAITVIVRGEDVLNDATMVDAEQIGLTDIVKVVGNGTGIAGTCLEEISEEASKIIADADVILSKGQGNFETLRKCGLNVYYAFLCKCDMFAHNFDVPKFTGMLINDKDC